MKAWEELLVLLEKQLGTETVSKWLRPIKIVRFDAANLYLEATPFQRAWFNEHVRARIAGLFRNNNHRPIRIHWEQEEKKRDSEKEKPLGDSLESSYRIENFLPFQPMALEIAQELLASQQSSDQFLNQVRYNPLVFFGPSGSGKTHLLMGLARALKELGRRVLYLHAETFTEQVVQAIRFGGMQEFRKATREIDFFIVDDIHQFARKNATQEEFFHTFNTLHTLGRQIILSAAQPPGKLEDIEQRLISRFEWGVAIPLQSLNQEQVRKVLEEKIKPLKIFNPVILIDFLMNRFRSTPKAPLEALYTLMIRSPKQIDLTQLERTLSDLLIKEQKFILTPEKIIKETAFYFGVLPEDLTGKSQQRTNVEPRKVALYLCRSLLHLPYQTIGRLFNRDHSTVMTSISYIQEAFDKRKVPFAEAVEQISRKVHLRKSE